MYRPLRTINYRTYPSSADKAAMLALVISTLSEQLGTPLRVTSHVRPDTNTHSDGDSVDVVPHLGKFVSREKSDPVLSFRDWLIPTLDNAARSLPYGGLILIENDHLHITLGIPESTSASPWTVTIQRDVHPKYPDTLERAERARFSYQPWTNCSAGAKISTQHSTGGQLLRFGVTGYDFKPGDK